MLSAPLSRACAQCGETFEKPRSCGLPEWEKRRFCSYACKARAQINQPSAKRGKSYGPSRAQKIPCRICGGPTRYNGISGQLLGMVHCGQEACREASKALKNAAISERHLADYQSGKRRRLVDGWSSVPRISREEQLLAPAMAQRGWLQQHGFKPGISDIHLPRYFILDFAKPEKRLYVEVDGSVHRLRQERDARRDAIMHERGWNGLRLPSSLVATDLERVLHGIDRFEIQLTMDAKK